MLLIRIYIEIYIYMFVKHVIQVWVVFNVLWFFSQSIPLTTYPTWTYSVNKQTFWSLIRRHYNNVFLHWLMKSWHLWVKYWLYLLQLLIIQICYFGSSLSLRPQESPSFLFGVFGITSKSTRLWWPSTIWIVLHFNHLFGDDKPDSNGFCHQIFL